MSDLQIIVEKINDGTLTLDDVDEMLEADIDINELLCLREISRKHNDEFHEAIEYYKRAKVSYNSTEILSKYDENKLHLIFMADDPYAVVVEMYYDEEIVQFGIENYGIDIELVRNQIGVEEAGESSELRGA
jgi:hypothetical protein